MNTLSFSLNEPGNRAIYSCPVIRRILAFRGTFSLHIAGDSHGLT